jgi:hypothetical protein
MTDEGRADARARVTGSIEALSPIRSPTRISRAGSFSRPPT